MHVCVCFFKHFLRLLVGFLFNQKFFPIKLPDKRGYRHHRVYQTQNSEN
jgi:hypothetical protein